MGRRQSAFITCLATLLISGIDSAAAAKPEIYFVPDVPGQFHQLALRPEPFGFWVWGHPNPEDNIDKHYQGIARSQGPGEPFLFAAWNGNDSFCITCDDDPGIVFVIRMGSRDTTGERLRTNRLLPGWPLANFIFGLDFGSPPDYRDAPVTLITFDGNGWPAYRHPGAMQVLGDVLAVPLSKPFADGLPPLRVQFIDIINPDSPSRLSHFDPHPPAPSDNNFGAGLVALTPVRNPGGGQRYLMLLAGEGGQEIRLYRSRSTDGTPDGPTDLTAPTISWVEFEAFTGDDLGTGWPCCDSQSPQMLNFVREGSLDGDLYLIGSHNPTSVLGIGGGRDYFMLYRVNVDAYGTPGHPLLTRIETLHVTTNSIAGDTAHFTGSTGVYVSPSGELILYANEHEEQGPFGIDPFTGETHRSVRAGEWRHREMVRPGSPTLQPSVEALGSYTVNEGGSVTVSAAGRQATTRAWLQLFDNSNLGLTDDDFNSELVFDYDDRNSEDYDNLPANVPFFNDEASAWRWFAPQGCTLEADQHSIDDEDFPGLYKQLPGDGTVQSASNLALVSPDNGAGSMNDMISAVRFFCDDYYNAAIGVSWDLDRNGSFETVGGSAVVSAAGLDGPGTLAIPVRAQHPTDTTALGQSAPQSVQVTVRNVAPSIATFGLFNSAGARIGTDVPFALVGVPVIARGTFTDPGTPDHQTAELNWGDGAVNGSGVFDDFSDAFGGRVGELAHAHVYAAASGYTVALAVTDDDGGSTNASAALTIVTPEQAIGAVIASLDQLIASLPSKSKLRKTLENARRALSGGTAGSSNDGALDKLRDGDRDAARAKVLEAIADLQDATGADVAELIAILEQVAQALT